MKKRFIIGYLLLVFGSVEFVVAMFLLLVYSNTFNIIIISRCFVEILIGLYLIKKANLLRKASNINEKT